METLSTRSQFTPGLLNSSILFNFKPFHYYVLLPSPINTDFIHSSRSLYVITRSRRCALTRNLQSISFDDRGHHEHQCRQSDRHNQHHDHYRENHGRSINRLRDQFVFFSKSIGWYNVAEFLREHLQLCLCSAAMLLAAALCPCILKKSVAKPLQSVLTLVAFPLVGVSALFDALIEMIDGKVNIHVLMALASIASVFMGNALEGGLLLVMFNLSHIAEEYFTKRSMIDIKELKEDYPEFALVLDIDHYSSDSDVFSKASKRVAVSDLDLGSFILVRAGEFVPVDCEVVKGRSTITMEHLTGEVKPVERMAGDKIPGGARNVDGMMIVKATKTWKQSTLNNIIQLTEHAQLNKPKLQRWLDEFGEQYSKVVLILSVVLAFLGPYAFKWPLISTYACRGSVYRSLGFMMAASPCALAVAPLAYITAISSCAKKGILLKGGHVLDAAASCHTIAFDKTGTLTTGKLKVKGIEPIFGHDINNTISKQALCCVPNCEKEALAVAAAMEQGSTHPIGRAIIAHKAEADIPYLSVENFESFPGKGLSATLTSVETRFGDSDVVKASLGSVDYITSLCTSKEDSNKIKEAVSASSYGSDFVRAALSVNKKITLLHFEDEPRPGVSSVVRSLIKEAKFHVMMLTGDHSSSAQRVANDVGITSVFPGLNPEDKLYHVDKISRNVGGGLIMVGDGINDAPALAAATVGVVLAEHASATAIAAADVLLLQDDISSVPFFIAKSRQTISLVKQNVALALFCISLGALPSVLGFLPLWLTVLLHEGGTLLVCLNSTRALKNNPNW